MLEQPLTLTGPIALHLVAASTATDTDWYAKLADVAPDGSESIITEGALRASHRALDPAKSRPARPYHPHTDPKPIEPGRFYDYDIEIWPTAYELAAGHRLQLRLTSTDLPTHLPGSYHFDRTTRRGRRGRSSRRRRTRSASAGATWCCRSCRTDEPTTRSEPIRARQSLRTAGPPTRRGPGRGLPRGRRPEPRRPR